MKKLGLLYLIIFLWNGTYLKAQESTIHKKEPPKSFFDKIGAKEKKTLSSSYPTFSIGYYYQKQSFGEVGIQLFFPLKDEADRFIFRTGASAIMGATSGKFAIMPKVKADFLFNLRKEVYVSHAYYYMIGAETTTKSFAPYIGFSIFGILDFTGGYSFSYPNQTLHGKEMQGFRLGVTFHIPTVIFE